jgi:HD-like signal output (HDOD) protein
VSTERILFVDDDPRLLDGLRRALWGADKDWELLQAASGPEALALLETTPCAIVVADMRMPGMDGAELLAEVRRRHPGTVRLMLSGHTAPGAALKAARPAHQYLSKPCPSEELVAVLDRMLRLRHVLASPELQAVVSGIDSLPVLPQLYTRVAEELGRKDPDMAAVGALIARDPAMSASMLKMVNSSFFGFVRRIANPEQAVVLLGSEVVKALILTTNLFSKFNEQTFQRFSLHKLWRHCLSNGRMAAAIAKAEEQPREAVDDCFCAGLLHDLGKLVVADALPERYHAVLELLEQGGRTSWQAEQEVVGVTHSELGAYLLGLWGLPEPTVLALAHHHRPETSPEPNFILTAVHAANVLDHELRREGENARPLLSESYLERMESGHRLEHWREACRRALPDGGGKAP